VEALSLAAVDPPGARGEPVDRIGAQDRLLELEALTQRRLQHLQDLPAAPPVLVEPAVVRLSNPDLHERGPVDVVEGDQVQHPRHRGEPGALAERGVAVGTRHEVPGGP